MRPVRVVHLIGSLEVGGAETVALDLTKSIPSSEVRQTFVCLSGRAGLLADEFVSAGAEVVPLPLGFGFASQLGCLLRGESPPQAIVSHVSLASGPLLAFARLCGVQTRIARFHSQADGKGGHIGRKVYRNVMRALVAHNATHVFGVTESSLDFGLGRMRATAVRGGATVAVVVNGVDTARFTPAQTSLPASPLVVVHVGRASPEKNRAILAPILLSLRRSGPSVMRLVGSSERSDLGPDSGGLTVIGPTRHVHEELRKAHVLVLPSLWEGLPTAILEALSCDIAVVASDLPGIAEIARLTDGVWLVPTDATPKQWAAAVRLAAATSGGGLIRKKFLESPYTLHRSVAIWGDLWLKGVYAADAPVTNARRGFG